MSVTRTEVEHVAQLARLAFSSDEAEEMASQLNRILEHADMLNEAVVSGVEPFEMSPASYSELRSDIEHDSVSAGRALQNAPASVEGFFTVPKVLAAGGGA